MPTLVVGMQELPKTHNMPTTSVSMAPYILQQRRRIRVGRRCMGYAEITREDRNAVKRFLQRRRLSDALSLAKKDSHPRTIVDFGAGDGEFCRLLAALFPDSRIFCYEPTPALRQEAAERLADHPGIVIADSVEALPKGQADLVFCMEVLEHLPERQTTETLAAIHATLSPGGRAVVGVPVEVFLPALFKGIFRMMRRFGDYDGRLGNILRAAIGFPPGDRPVEEIATGLPYHFSHLGFDYRVLRKQLQEQFHIRRIVGSPAKFLPPCLNSEVYFILQKS